MEAIKAEIERKKRKLEEQKLIDPDKKYFRRGDLAIVHLSEYRQRMGLTADPVVTDDAADSSRVCVDSLSSAAGDGGPQLVRAEVVRRLRDRFEPVLLFGETEQEAFQRLRRLEILEPEITRGLRNDFQEAMEKVDRAYVDELLAPAPADADSTAAGASREEEPRLSWEQLQESTQTLGVGTSTDVDNSHILLKLYKPSPRDIKQGCRVFDLAFIFGIAAVSGAKPLLKPMSKFLLSEWGHQIGGLPVLERQSVCGKMALATYKQTQNYLKPLFRQLKNAALSGDILEALIEIAQCMLDRNYLKASDAYLQMAIGNAAWPIGVTMVGIHARTGREKIHSKHVAHVLNDETQRKYIQGLKRLMTKCQELFPTDPSRSVEYGGLVDLSQKPAVE